MKNKNKIGKIYEFCASCSACPVAIEAKVGKERGLEIRDDFGGKVEMTDGNLKDLMSFLQKRLGK